MPVRQLDQTIVNRIAAGEVVERPASVVKELIENALDAGAKRIEIVTDGGGRRLIRVTDDGGGMTRADLALSVERHATSKLPENDLLDIRTLGFRGEALPSIGSVARLIIATRHAGEPNAWSIAVDAGEKSDVRPAALSEGTRVEVRDLFYATPARLKFLKTDRTEAEAIRDVVRRLAMSRPDVAFTLAGEERAPVTWGAALPGLAGRLARLGDVLGADFRANAVEVRGGREGLTIEGYAALPTYSKGNALSQYLFVNGRPVRDRLMLGAVRGAYADYLPRDRHPVVALFVTVEPREVDVNVHPAKTEVRFRDSGLVRASIVRALQDALARDAQRAATTGGAATVAAFRPNASPRGWDWRASPARPLTPGCDGARGFRRSRTGGLRRRRAVGRHARRGRGCAGSHRAAARRRARATARNLHCGADARRHRHCRPACSPRAHRLRAHEGRARAIRRRAADPADPRNRRARRGGRRASRGARIRAWPGSALWSSRSVPAPSRSPKRRRCSVTLMRKPCCATSPSTWPNGTRRCRSSAG